MDTLNNWYIYYEEAKKYYEENNNLLITGSYIPKNSNLRLGSWIIRMRSLYKENKLSKEKIDLLNKIGMEWNIKGVYERDYFVAWMTYYNEVLAYYNEHKNVNIPANYIVNSNGVKLNLQIWLSSQKSKLKYDKLGYNDILKTKLLSNIGLTKEEVTKNMAEEKNNLMWFKNYEVLLLYYKEFSSLDIPATYVYTLPDNTTVNLGAWFRKQVQRYFNKDTHSLTKEQYDLLTKLGIASLEQKVNEKKPTWMDYYNLLIMYIEQNATLTIPKNYLVEFNGKKINIGSWYRRQLAKYENESLSIKQMKLIGKLRCEKPSISEVPLTWYNYYRALINFYKENNHLAVPINYTVVIKNNVVKLGSYLNDIRQGKITLTKEQIRQLNDLSMIWDKDEYENKIYFQTWLSTYNAVKECIKLYKTPLICEDFYVTVNNVKVNLNAWIKMQLKLLSHNMLSEKQISMLRNIGIDKKLGNVMEDLCLLTKRNY